MGTRNKSAPLRPMTIAGRTLRLVKSVKGIGSRTTSFLEQFIVDVVGIVVPGFEQGCFGKLQPKAAPKKTNNGNYLAVCLPFSFDEISSKDVGYYELGQVKNAIKLVIMIKQPFCGELFVD